MAHVKMSETIVGPEGPLYAGDVYDLPSKRATVLVKAGYAKQIPPPQNKEARQPADKSAGA